MRFNTNFKNYLSLFRHPSLLVILCFGFASSLPVALMGAILVTRLVEEGFSKGQAALVMWLHLPFSLKILWSPVVDFVRLPLLKPLLGQRASWAAASLTATMISLMGVAWTDASHQWLLFAFFALLTSFFSGAVYIVGIAYEMESIDRSLYAAGSALVNMGYRLGLFVGATGTLYLSDFYNWSVAYTIVSVLISVGIGAILLRGKIEERPHAAKGNVILLAWHAWIDPIKEFIFRPSFLGVMLFIFFYQIGDHLMELMLNPFLLEIGFTKSQIANVVKVWGLPFTLLGAFMGGYLGTRYPLFWVLCILGMFHAVSQLFYSALAQNPHLSLFYSASALEHLTGGMAMTCFITWLWRQTTLQFASVQYTLIWTWISFKKALLAPLSGFLASHLDWPLFFVTVACLSLLASSLPLLRRKEISYN